MTTLANNQLFSSVPVGTILPCLLPASALPTGWFLCNGQNVSAKLPISKYLTVVSGKVTLPNLSGLTLIGAGLAASNTSYSLFQTGGEEKHTLTINEIPSHTHTAPTNMGGNPYSNGNAVYGSDRGQQDGYKPFTTQATGGSAAHNNMQPYFVANYMIYCGVA